MTEVEHTTDEALVLQALALYDATDRHLTEFPALAARIRSGELRLVRAHEPFNASEPCAYERERDALRAELARVTASEEYVTAYAYGCCNAERVRFLAERDALATRVATLEAALRETRKGEDREDGLPCWCPSPTYRTPGSVTVRPNGTLRSEHAANCNAARAALSPAPAKDCVGTDGV